VARRLVGERPQPPARPPGALVRLPSFRALRGDRRPARVAAPCSGELADEGTTEPLAWARKHYEIIARFGRYPHRNEALGRASTAEEIEFLRQPGSGF